MLLSRRDVLPWLCVLVPLIGCGSSRDPAAPPEATATDAALGSIDAFVAAAVAAGEIDKTTPGWRLRMPAPPHVEFAPGATYTWALQTTKGPLAIRLLTGVAPRHVASTVYLTRAGFYDGLGFHRVTAGFMAQGGCPLGTGTGEPGYRLEGEIDDDVVFDRAGLVASANYGPGTDGSQFFVTFGPAERWNGGFTIFGEVAGGADTLAAFEHAAQTREQMTETESEAPLDPLTILAATIRVDGS